jgi:FKBP-type peptidyl-prolyl cis-trans isomerase FklB
MRFKQILLTGSALLLFTACQGQKGKTAKVEMKTKEDSVSYALGVSIANNLKKSGFENLNIDLMAQAMKSMLAGDSVKIQVADADPLIQQYMQGVQARKSEAATAKGKQFLEENAKKEGVVTLPSGLQYMILKEGTGEKPGLTDKVSTHYHGTLLDGTVFDSSVERGQPAEFNVNQVIPGWTEALQLMPVGSKWKLFIPSNLAYGERGAGGAIGPHETLIFEVELLSIVK